MAAEAAAPQAPLGRPSLTSAMRLFQLLLLLAAVALAVYLLAGPASEEGHSDEAGPAAGLDSSGADNEEAHGEASDADNGSKEDAASDADNGSKEDAATDADNGN